MEKKIKRNEIMLMIISAVPIIIYLICWNSLPEKMPIHYDGNMNPNGYSSKIAAFIFISGLTIGMYLLFKYLPSIDPRGKIQKHQRAFIVTRFIIAALISFIGVLIVVMALNKIPPAVMSAAICVLFAALFIGLGNYLPVIKQNFFIGIRTPWTLTSESVWAKTHRIGGRLFVVGGLLMLISAFIPSAELAISIVVGIAVAIATYLVFYSFYLFKKEKQTVK